METLDYRSRLSSMMIALESLYSFHEQFGSSKMSGLMMRKSEGITIFYFG
jgi:hypothetical protein